MNEIIEKIKELGFGEYAVCHDGEERYLLVFMSYKYYKEASDKNFSVSPYYFASNRAYFASKELAQYINRLGYKAQVKNHIIYDELLERCGAKRGDNNLFFIDKYGSLFCVHVIQTDAPLVDRRVGGKECTHCGRCIAVCPMRALSREGINKEMCMRERMDIIGDKICRDKITTLLGCDKCQQVCPKNKGEIEIKTYPQFDKEKIITGDMTGISQLVGKNMARKQRLQFQGMCIAAGRADKSCENAVSMVCENRLEDTKNWCLEILKAVDLRNGK